MLISVHEYGSSLKCVLHIWESIALFRFLFHLQKLEAAEGY